MVRVHEVTREELLARRDQILARVGTTDADLTERSRLGSLVGDEDAALEELRDIAYLLGE
ncbi:MAG: hypothetical protein ABIO67_09025 [Mycobacteriales bacterium]